MHLMQMEVDADSQHTVDLLTKSASMHAAPCSLDAAGSSKDLGRTGSGRGPSNLRHASGPGSSNGGAQDGDVGAAGAAAAGAAGGGNGRALPAAGRSASGGFSFKMFGKDVGAAGGGSSGGGSTALQVGCC